MIVNQANKVLKSSLAYQDARDLKKVAELIRKGKISEARRKAQSMDTDAREQIPAYAWNLMYPSE